LEVQRAKVKNDLDDNEAQEEKAKDVQRETGQVRRRRREGGGRGEGGRE